MHACLRTYVAPRSCWLASEAAPPAGTPCRRQPAPAGTMLELKRRRLESLQTLVASVKAQQAALRVAAGLHGLAAQLRTSWRVRTYVRTYVCR